MTMVPMWKKCPRCKRRYSWNPDVGQMWCPHCGPLSMPGVEIPFPKIKEILSGKKK